MRSGRQLIKEIRAKVEGGRSLRGPRAAGPERRQRRDLVIVDVREQGEWEQGHIPGAVHVPRELPRVAHRERRPRPRASDRDLYCATGQRSALAANTLEELLGYEDVASMNGGFTLWKDRGYPFDRPTVLTAEQQERYSRHLLDPGGRHRGPAEAARREGAADRRGRARLAGGAVPGGGRRRHARHRRRRRGRPHEPPAPGDPQHRARSASPRSSRRARRSRRSTRTSRWCRYQTRLDQDNVLDLIRDYDVIVDGADNFPTRYLLNDAAVRERKPVVHASILGFDGQLTVFVPVRGPVLPLPLPAAAAGRPRAVVRRQRRAGRAAGHHGPAPGERGDQADHRHGRAAGRAAAAVRGALDPVHRSCGSAATPRAARSAATASISSDTEFEDYEALCAAAG